MEEGEGCPIYCFRVQECLEMRTRTVDIRLTEVLAVLGVVLGLFNTGWQIYVYRSSQTIPATLVVYDVQDIELWVYRDFREIEMTINTKIPVMAYVITDHEFKLRVIDGRFEWANVTERLGPSYITPGQGVSLGTNKDFIGLQSGSVNLWINVTCRFKTNQSAFWRYNQIPLGKFYFTLEYQDLKTRYTLRQTNATQVSWMVRLY
jgi:hypothetical protein